MPALLSCSMITARRHSGRYTGHLLLTACLCLSLAACANHSKKPEPATTFQPATNTRSQQSSLYLYRTSTSTNWLYSTEIAIDDSHLFEIKPGQMRHLVLDNKTHRIKLLTDEQFSGQQQIDLAMQAGRTYFLRVSTSLKLDGSSNFQPYKRSFDLQLVESQQAIKQINECCYTEKTQQKTVVTEDSVQHENSVDDSKNGFSVDKTSNPFSHQP